MRPLLSEARAAVAGAWTPPPQVTFGPTHRAAAAIAAELGSLGPPTATALAYWEARRDGGASEDERLVVRAIRAKVEELYGGSRSTLKAAYGLHCAYCEVPVSDYTHVEHVAAKTQFPLRSLSLDNFLPACGICNGTKSDLPDRVLLAAACGTDDEPTVAAHLHASVALPDHGVTTHSLAPVIVGRTGSGWVELTNQAGPEVAVAADTVGVPLQVDDPVLGLVPVQVHHRPVTGPAAVIQTLVGLDRGGRNDGRMALRTRAWVNAVAELHDLGLPGALPATVPHRTLRFAAQTGFSLVWVTVAEHLGWRPVLEPKLLAHLPGTDMARVGP